MLGIILKIKKYWKPLAILAGILVLWYAYHSWKASIREEAIREVNIHTLEHNAEENKKQQQKLDKVDEAGKEITKELQDKNQDAQKELQKMLDLIHTSEDPGKAILNELIDLTAPSEGDSGNPSIDAWKKQK